MSQNGEDDLLWQIGPQIWLCLTTLISEPKEEQHYSYLFLLDKF